MAFGSGLNWEIRTTGSNSQCSGGFNPQSNGMINDGAATDANTTAPVFTSASYTFVAGDVGALLFIKSGTNWIPGWYEIVSVAAGAATLDATTGNPTLWAGNLGSVNSVESYTPSTVDGCATTASPTGATWSVDYSQQDTAAIAFTDLVSVTTTTLTSAANPFGKNHVGNTINIVSGTSWTVQVVEITQVNSATNVATVEKTVGGAGLTGGTGYLGGAIAEPQFVAASSTTGGIRYWIKSGTYTISSTTNNVAGGRFTFGNSGIMEGYGSRRGDLGTSPVFQASGIASVYLITAAGTAIINNIKADGAGLAGISGFSGVSLVTMLNFCSAINCINGFRDGTLYRCSSDTCTNGFTYSGIATLRATFSVAKDCTSAGFQGSRSTFINCIATGCPKGFNNIGGSSEPNAFYNCTAYDCSTSGFNVTSAQDFYYGCLAVSATYGFEFNTGTGRMYNCAGYNNTSGDVRYNGSTFAGGISNYEFKSLSADPFTDAVNGDFSLNNTAGGGAELKAISITFPAITSTISYPDIGAVQDQGGGGGGGGDTESSYAGI